MSDVVIDLKKWAYRMWEEKSGSASASIEDANADATTRGQRGYPQVFTKISPQRDETTVYCVQVQSRFAVSPPHE